MHNTFNLELAIFKGGEQICSYTQKLNELVCYVNCATVSFNPK